MKASTTANRVKPASKASKANRASRAKTASKASQAAGNDSQQTVAALDLAKAGKTYEVVSCDMQGRLRNKLETLGIVIGSSLEVNSNSGSGLIINVKRSRLALSREIAGHLIVRES